jgi:hypothetical protein
MLFCFYIMLFYIFSWRFPSIFTLGHEGVWGSGCRDPYFFDLGTSWILVVRFMPRSLYPRGKSPGIYWIGGWVGPRARMDDVEKKILPTGTQTPTSRSSSS